MRRGYRSFLVRVWRLGDGQARAEVEQIQTGERLRGVPLETALAWLRDQAPAGEAVAAPGLADPNRATTGPSADVR
jgi:hypothetical protein